MRPLLEAMAKQFFLTGVLGSGHAMKALNNLVSAAGLWIAAEAFLIGKQFGLQPETMVDVLNASTGRDDSRQINSSSRFCHAALPRAFGCGLMAKDLRTANELAIETGTFAPFTQECTALWGRCRPPAGKLRRSYGRRTGSGTGERAEVVLINGEPVVKGC